MTALTAPMIHDPTPRDIELFAANVVLLQEQVSLSDWVTAAQKAGKLDPRELDLRIFNVRCALALVKLAADAAKKSEQPK